MTSAIWGQGSNLGPYTGAYENGANWLPMVVPNETAHFAFSYVNTVTITSPVSVGAWSVTASYVFLSYGTLSFTGAGISGPPVLINSGTINFLNSSSAGNAVIVVAKTGTLNFSGGSTGGNATIAVDAENGQFGQVNFLGDGPAHDHRLTVGSLQGDGIFNLGSNEVTVGATDANMTVSGQIIGSGRLVKTGWGTMTLDGFSHSSNSGGIFVDGGVLIVNGVAGKVTVGNPATGNGALVGIGSLGATNIAYGYISAGHEEYAHGRMTVRGLTLQQSSSLIVDVESPWVAGSGYDQIQVVGKVRLNRGDVSVNTNVDYNPTARHTLMIVNNDGRDKVAGIFSDDNLDGTLSEGDAFLAGEQVYSISYNGGTGNDIVLRSQGPFAGGTNGGDLISPNASPTYTTTKLADYVFSRDGNDTIFAAGGNDTVQAGGGADFMDGGAGKDFVTFSDESGDFIVTLKGSKLSTVMLNGVAHDQIKNFENAGGGDGNDRLVGDRKANVLLGQRGNDTLKGGAGNDVLVSGYGNDVLTGGGGRDKFVFNSFGTYAADFLTDFRRGQDKLLLEGRQFYELGNKVDKSDFYAKKGATQAHDADDHLIYDTRTGNLYYDRDGLGGYGANIIATIKGHPKLTISDFEIV